MRLQTILAATGALVLPWMVPACGSGPAVDAAPLQPEPHAFDPVGAPTVVGTAVEAATGRPLAGVSIQGPGGSQAVSDAEGRFVLRGLAEGMEGELVGTTEAGLRGSNRLRPLKAGRLEVVLFLR